MFGLYGSVASFVMSCFHGWNEFSVQPLPSSYPFLPFPSHWQTLSSHFSILGQGFLWGGLLQNAKHICAQMSFKHQQHLVTSLSQLSGESMYMFGLYRSATSHVGHWQASLSHGTILHILKFKHIHMGVIISVWNKNVLHSPYRCKIYKSFGGIFCKLKDASLLTNIARGTTDPGY